MSDRRTLRTRFDCSRLRCRLVFGVAAVHALLMLVFVVDQAWRRRAAYLDLCEADARAHAETLAALCADAVATREVATLQAAVIAHFDSESHVFAALTDDAGLVLAHSDPSLCGSRLGDSPASAAGAVLARTPALVEVATPVRAGGRQVGWARVGVRLDRADEKFHAVVFGGAAYAAVAAGIGLIVAWFAVGRLTRRLERIRGTVARVRAGDATARTGLDGADEATELADAFDLMLDELGDRDRRLRAGEARFRLIFDESPVAIWVEDASALKLRLDALRREGVTDLRAHLDAHPETLAELTTLVRVLDINRRSVELLKADGVDQVSRDLGRHFNEDSRRVFKEEVLALAEGRLRFQASTTILDAQGAPIPVELALAVQPGAETDLSRVLVSFIDVTERQRADAERERLHARLIQAEKLESLGRLAGGVAHDFNNMLTVILGQSELALRELESGHPARGAIAEAHGAAERSVHLVRQLLTFARKQTVAPRVLDLNEAVAAMAGMLRRLIGGEVRLTFLPGESVRPVRIDPAQVDQLLANLCVNARDAMPAGGEITLATRNITLDEADCVAMSAGAPGDYTLLSVADTGCGMDAETQANMFEPFFTTKAPGKGTGLGLATVYGIVRQNGGFIRVDSRVGTGTIFRLYLPQCAPAPAAPAPTPPAPGAAAVTPAAGGARILVVEDNPAILALLASMLELQGHTVRCAASPAAALAHAERPETAIDLLLTDVVMPEMNGHELANRLRVLRPGLRLVFMSGHTADIISRHGEIEPGMHFIQKPFSVAALCAKVREALDTPVSPAAAP